MISELTYDVEDPLVVDVGCGNGDFLQYFSKDSTTSRFIGVEPSLAGSEISARKVGPANIRRIDLITASPNDTKEIHADVVVCTEVLEHLDEPVELLSAIRTKIMKPGSRIVVSVPGGPRSAFDFHIGHRRHFSKARLIEALKSAGYDEIKVMRSGFPVFNLYKSAVIVMGKRLILTPEKFQSSTDEPSRLSSIITRLMDAGPKDTPFGWQLFASAVSRSVD